MDKFRAFLKLDKGPFVIRNSLWLFMTANEEILRVLFKTKVKIPG